jgi:hypothetical protein
VYDASCLSSWSSAVVVVVVEMVGVAVTIPYTTLPGQDAPAGPPKRVVPSPGNGSGSEVGSSAIRFRTLFAGG